MFTRRTLLAAVSVATLVAHPIVAAAQELPRNIRMVIGSTSTGGDTYQNAALVADALSQHLGVNVKVDPVGTSEGLKALGRDKRGTTIMLHHDQVYLSYLYGVPGNEDPFANYSIGPTVAINPGDAFLVPADSPYKTMEDVFKAAEEGKQIRVAIQPGGVSEIGFTAMRNAAKTRAPGSEKNFVPVNTGSQADKNQAMWDGLADLINGSIQANEQFTQLSGDDAKAMRFIWITARPQTLEQAPEQGMGNTTRDQFLQYASPKTSVTLDGEKDFAFDKEFFLIYNKEMDPAQMEAIDKALAEIYEKGDLEKRQKEAFFIPNYLPQAEAQAHLSEKSKTIGGLIEQLKTE
ncbi:ABC transporter substrate-binding protein [Pseudorhizobium halotolerans]|uniref:ABC transporter substrate-binding protein n=1 Tax=Pseudorhizobium halotolerans TaxID=1233081 RepID=A0ABM8PWQ6_9HYPH|nr:ABC transporter substrate-binding protein [Pseudorhizobium halotolerans]CAD7052508.1 ABC transporter substrate-binding protein [Pseudorhizobium halotolerans]